jgi:hypothetical protein
LDLAAGIPQAPVTSTRTVTRTAAFTSHATAAIMTVCGNWLALLPGVP